MKINWTKVVNNILWFLGAVMAFFVLLGTFGKVNIIKPSPKKVKTKVKKKHEEINVDINNIGNSDFGVQ